MWSRGPRATLWSTTQSERPWTTSVRWLGHWKRLPIMQLRAGLTAGPWGNVHAMHALLRSTSPCNSTVCELGRAGLSPALHALGAGFGAFQLSMLFYCGCAWAADATEMMLLSFLGPAVRAGSSSPLCQLNLLPGSLSPDPGADASLPTHAAGLICGPWVSSHQGSITVWQSVRRQ